MILPGSSPRNRKRQTGEQGTDSKETGPGDPQPKLPKTTASAPQPRQLANTSDLTAVVWAHHWSHHTQTQLDGLSLLKCKMPCKKQLFSKRCLNQFLWLALSRVQLGLLGHIILGWHWNVCFHTHKKSIYHLRMQFYQLFIS